MVGFNVILMFSLTRMTNQLDVDLTRKAIGRREGEGRLPHEEGRGRVCAVVAGHLHRGGYAVDDCGVHHLTLSSPLNMGAAGRAYGLVALFADRIELRGPRLDDLLPLPWPGRPPTRRDDERGEDVISFALDVQPQPNAP